MDRLHTKIVLLGLTFAIPCISGLLPLKLYHYFSRKGRTGQVVMDNLMCFAGGIFLGTFMLHVAPEARDLVRISINEPLSITYPLSELFMTIGFFLVIATEQGVMAFAKTQTTTETTNDAVDYLGDKHSCPTTDTGSGRRRCSRCGLCRIADPEQHGFIDNEELLALDSHSRRAILLIIALSFHRIFEGISIGFQKTVSALWNLFGAVMCHEVVIGFSLGVQFVRNTWGVKRTVVTTLCCSLVMPLGAGIGTLLMELQGSGHVMKILNGVLQSLATGTFIYVTFFEILGDELSAEHVTKWKIFSVFVGFALMAALVAASELEVQYMININNDCPCGYTNSTGSNNTIEVNI